MLQNVDPMRVVHTIFAESHVRSHCAIVQCAPGDDCENVLLDVGLKNVDESFTCSNAPSTTSAVF